MKKNPLLQVNLCYKIPSGSTSFDLPQLTNYDSRRLRGIVTRTGNATRKSSGGRILIPAASADAAFLTIKSGTEEMVSVPLELTSFDNIKNSPRPFYELNLNDWVWNNSFITFATPPTVDCDIEITLYLENKTVNTEIA